MCFIIACKSFVFTHLNCCCSALLAFGHYMKPPVDDDDDDADEDDDEPFSIPLYEAFSKVFRLWHKRDHEVHITRACLACDKL